MYKLQKFWKSKTFNSSSKRFDYRYIKFWNSICEYKYWTWFLWFNWYTFMHVQSNCFIIIWYTYSNWAIVLIIIQYPELKLKTLFFLINALQNYMYFAPSNCCFFNVVYETLLLLTWCTFFWNQQWELSLVPLSVISYLVAQSVKVFRLWSVGLRFIFHTCPVLPFVLFDISNKFNFGENVVENEIFEKSMFPISIQFYLYKYCKVSHSTLKMF